MRNYEIVSADVLVIGGGGAASRAAISANDAGASVLMAVKGKYGFCGSTSIAFAESTMITGSPLDGESNQSLFDDTFRAGMGTISPELLEVLVRDCGERVDDLAKFGLQMSRKVYTDLSVSGFAHSTPRTYIVESRMERSVLEVLVREVRTRPIQICEQVQIVRLLTRDGQTVGAIGLRSDNGVVVFKAGSVILAGGGAHGLFPHHPSTGEMIGDSFAMCYHAGLTMVNMELVQIGYMSVAPVKRILSAPNWRLEPKLTNALGEPFLQKYLPENVTEDEIFRTAQFPYTTTASYRYLHQAIYTEITEGRGENDAIWFDVTYRGKEAILSQAPYTYAVMKSSGLDMSADKLPISIGVQTFHGGCLIDSASGSELNGLYVCGEAAGGLMGADRPGGNALAECQVFGHIAGLNAAASCKTSASDPDADLLRLAEQTLDAAEAETGASFSEIIQELRSIMFRSCLTIRDAEHLRSAIEKIDGLGRQKSSGARGLQDRISAANALTAAKLIAVSAIRREDSRGVHFRSDYPERLPKFDCSIAVRKQGDEMDVFLKHL